MVLAPPRPPRLDSEPEALIEEARQRQRRRRRFAGLSVFATAGAIGLGLGIWQGGAGPGRPSSASGRPPSGPSARAREEREIARVASTAFVGAAKSVGAGRGWAMNGLALYWTSDNGRHWRIITPPGIGDVIARVIDIASIGDRQIWVSASDIPGWRVVHGSLRHMEILRTRDGGRSWHAAIPPGCYGCGPAYVSFLDARHGFALTGSPDRLYESADGGAKWRLVATAPFHGQLAFVTRREAWGVSDPTGWVGHDEFPVGGGKLFRTVDGGKRWERVRLRPPAADARDPSVAELPRFFGTRTGVVAVRYREPRTHAQNLVVYVTADGGRTWSARPGPDSADLNGLQWGIAGIPFSAADARHWFVFPGPRLHATADAGKTWTTVRPVYSPRAPHVYDVTFTSAGSGWAIFFVADGAALVRTVNGGRSWTPLAPPVHEPPLPPPPATCGSPCRRP